MIIVRKRTELFRSFRAHTRQDCTGSSSVTAMETIIFSPKNRRNITTKTLFQSSHRRGRQFWLTASSFTAVNRTARKRDDLSIHFIYTTGVPASGTPRIGSNRVQSIRSPPSTAANQPWMSTFEVLLIMALSMALSIETFPLKLRCCWPKLLTLLVNIVRIFLFFIVEQFFGKNNKTFWRINAFCL